MSRSKRSEGAPSATPYILEDDAFVLLLDGSHWPQALCDFEKARNDAWFETTLQMWCVRRQIERPIAETEALKVSKFANKESIIMGRNSSFEATVNSVKNFSAAFEKGHGVSFFAAWIVHIV